MSEYRKLKVWQKAHVMALSVNAVAIKIRSRHYGSLRSQLIRSALSVPANIVEASGQESSRDFCRFLRYALNSAREVEYHCLVSRDIGLIGARDQERLMSEIVEIQRMLYGLIKYVRLRSAHDDASDVPVAK